MGGVGQTVGWWEGQVRQWVGERDRSDSEQAVEVG